MFHPKQFFCFQNQPQASPKVDETVLDMCITTVWCLYGDIREISFAGKHCIYESLNSMSCSHTGLDLRRQVYEAVTGLSEVWDRDSSSLFDELSHSVQLLRRDEDKLPSVVDHSCANTRVYQSAVSHAD